MRGTPDQYRLMLFTAGSYSAPPTLAFTVEREWQRVRLSWTRQASMRRASPAWPSLHPWRWATTASNSTTSRCYEPIQLTDYSRRKVAQDRGDDELELQEDDGRWKYFHLIYLAFYFPEWLWRPPGVADLVAAAIAMAVFIPIYFTAYERSGARYLSHIVAYEVIAFAVSPFSGLHGVFHVYACVQAGFQRPRQTAIRGILLLTFAYAAVTFLLQPSIQDVINAVFALVIGLVTGIACISQAETLERERPEARAGAGATARYAGRARTHRT